MKLLQSAHRGASASSPIKPGTKGVLGELTSRLFQDISHGANSGVPASQLKQLKRQFEGGFPLMTPNIDTVLSTVPSQQHYALQHVLGNKKSFKELLDNIVATQSSGDINRHNLNLTAGYGSGRPLMRDYLAKTVKDLRKTMRPDELKALRGEMRQQPGLNESLQNNLITTTHNATGSLRSYLKQLPNFA